MTGSRSQSNQLFILAGPSCAGKTPLIKAFRIHYPEFAARFQQVVPYTSRTPRPEETDGRDYHFIDKIEFEAVVQANHMISLTVRGDRQAINSAEIRKKLSRGPVLYEGNTFLARMLISQAEESKLACTSVFLSPFHLSDLKILFTQLGREGARKRISEIMRLKLEKRAIRKGFVTNENIDQRVRETFAEINLAGEFDFVIVNPLGEESEIWDHPDRLNGSALKVLHTFAEILMTGTSESAEKWPADLSGENIG